MKWIPPPFIPHPSPIQLFAVIAALLITAGLASLVDQHRRQSTLHVGDKQLSETRNELLGSTTFTTYLNESKKVLEGQTTFLAAKVEREYVQVEHIQKSTLGWKSEATVIVKYGVEYSFGFDLRPDRFSLTGNRNGITITLSKPELVASPAITRLSHEIPSTGIFIDEQAAVIHLQERLYPTILYRSKDIQQEAAVQVLCEKRLADFLRDVLSRQPNFGVIPAITFEYK